MPPTQFHSATPHRNVANGRHTVYLNIQPRSPWRPMSLALTVRKYRRSQACWLMYQQEAGDQRRRCDYHAVTQNMTRVFP